MVAVIGGNRLGLHESSLAALGRFGAGQTGTAAQGQSGERAYVDVSTGNLVLQGMDGLLVGLGPDVTNLRTYNSQGLTNFTNNDGWSNGHYKSVVNIGGGVLRRTEVDGSTTDYEWNTTLAAYVETYSPGGAVDTIKVVAGGEYEWTSGATGGTERYQGSGAGLILWAKDANGSSQLNFSYTGNLLTGVSTANGESVAYVYTGNNLTQMTTKGTGGQVLSQVDYSYDGSNRLMSVSVKLNPLNQSQVSSAETLTTYTTNYTYDGATNRVASVTQADGTTVSFTYALVNGSYRVETVTDGNGAITQFGYNTTTNTTTVTDPYGVSSVYVYDSATGQITQVRMGVTAGNSAGLSQSNYTYSTLGEVLTVTDGQGRTITMTYETNVVGKGNLLSRVDSAGDTTTWTYNGMNQVQTERVYAVPANGAVAASEPKITRYVYAAGNATLLRFVISPEGRVTEYGYNGLGLRTSSISYAAGTYSTSGLGETAVPTEAQLQTWVTAQDRTKTSRQDFAYNFQGQLQTSTSYGSTDAAGNGVAGTASVTQYVYSQRGELLQTITPDTKGIRELIYDGLGRVVMTVERSSDVGQAALTKTTITQYDEAHGKVTTTLDNGNGLSTASVFDHAGRLVSVVQLSGATTLGTTSYEYDKDGRLLMTTDPTGKHAWAIYDAAGRKVGDIDASGGLTEYVYNTSSQVTQTIRYAQPVSTTGLVDGNGKATTSLSGTTTLVNIKPPADPADQKQWNLYDSAGRLAWQVDGMGYVTQTTYDGASRVIATTRFSTAIATSALGNGIGVTIGLTGTNTVTVATNAKDRTTTFIYSDDGLLRATIDGEGYLTERIYDGVGQLVQTKQYVNQISQFTDAASIAAKVAAVRSGGPWSGLLPTADPANDISTYAYYDGKGQLVGQVDGKGYLTEMTYDSNGRVIQTTRYFKPAAGTVSTSATLGTLKPQANAEDQVTSNTWDDLGRLKTQTNAEGTVTEYVYDVLGNLIRTTTALNTADERIGSLRYDVQGRVTAQLSAVGSAKVKDGSLTTEEAWAQYATKYAYDAAGRRVSETDALGHRTVFFYDDAGRIRFTVDAAGRVHETTYDALGHVKTSTQYATALTGTNLTGLVGGLLSATANQAGVTALAAAKSASTKNATTAMTYNSVGLMTRSVMDALVAGDGLGGTATWVYNAFRDMESATQSLDGSTNVTSTRSYDRRGLLIDSLSDQGGLNLATHFTYDGFGRMTDSRDARLNTTHQDYDRLGRVVTVTDAMGKSSSATYDAFSRVLTQTDARLNTTSYAYDTANRKMTMTTAEGATQGFTVETVHTRNGQTFTVKDGNGKITTYEYNQEGRLLKTTLPTGLPGRGYIENDYDKAGNLWHTTDNNGTVVEYAYDAVNRVLTRTVDKGTGKLNLVTSYTYDLTRPRTTITDGGTVTQIDYDLKGQVATQTVDPLGLNIQTVYSYDQKGNVLSVTEGKTSTSAGIKTRYVYDKLGRRTYTVDGEGGVTGFKYDANGNLVDRISYATRITWASGSMPAPTVETAHDQQVRWVYDENNRALFTLSSTDNGSLVSVVASTYDNVGNEVTRTAYADTIAAPSAGATATQLKTAAQALVTAQNTTPNPANATIRRVYDKDNRLTWSVNGAGAVTQQVFDKNGNLIKQVAYAKAIVAGADPVTSADQNDASNRVTLMGYDAANRLRFTVDALGGVAEAVYDGNGNVVKRIAYAAATTVPTTASAPLASNFTPATDPADRTTWAIYDAVGRQVFSIVSSGTAASGTGARGAVVKNVYDGGGRLVGTTAYATQLTPAELAGITTATTQASLTTTMTGKVSTDDRTTILAYDGAGRQVYKVDALGYATEHSYDGLGRVTRTVLYSQKPSGGVVVGASADTIKGKLPLTPNVTVDRVNSFAYDAAGNLTSSTDALGFTESYTYDGVGNKKSFTNKKTAIWTYDYDAAGRLTQETSPQVAVTTLQQNGTTGTLSEVSTANTAIVTKLTYDALGNLVSRKEAYGTSSERETKYKYDALGHQTETTYPSVWVYNAADLTNLATDGAGPSARTETNPTLTTKVFYNAFGEAVINIDVAGKASSKVYDKTGRVVYDIDALGYLTQYDRNAFGDVTALTRYSNWITLSPNIGQGAVYAPTQTEVSSAVTGFTLEKRRIDTTYDLLGRTSQVTQPAAYVYDSVTGSGYSRSAVTRTTYNAFGEVFESKVLASAPNGPDGIGAVWAITTYHYDVRGQLAATVDPMGYVTTQSYDEAGNLKQQTQYAAASSGWVPGMAAPVVTATSGANRTVAYTYDLMNRKKTETQVGVVYSTASDGTEVSTPGDLTTTYGYDQVGNLTSTTDALGNQTVTDYDALGRTNWVKAPAQGTAGGLLLVPRTTFKRDVFGNVVVQTQEQLYQGTLSSQPMATGQNLVVGQTMGSSDGRFLLTLQADGDLVINDRQSGALIWNTQTMGSGADRLEFKADGSLVLMKGTTQVWGAGSTGLLGTQLTLRTDGRLAMTNAGGKVVWQSQKPCLEASAATSLSSGQKLLKGQSIYSKDGRYELTLQENGNLVLLNKPAGTIRWQTNTANRNVEYFILQTDGNMVLYTAAGGGVWFGGTQGRAGISLRVGEDGNLALYTASSVAVWGTSTVSAVVTPKPYLTSGQTLSVGGNLDSINGKYRSTLQADGNWVITDRVTSAVVWSAGTAGTGANSVALKADGTLAVYAGTQLVWSAGTAGQGGATLSMQQNGALVLYGADGTAIWDSSMTAAPTLSASSRTTLTKYDALGHATAVTDALGINHYMSYDAAGRLVKSWQGVTDAGGTVRTLYAAFVYDALGRQTSILTPASTSLLAGTVTGGNLHDGSAVTTQTQTLAGSVVVGLKYNSFGEVTDRGSYKQGETLQFQEKYEYDAAGRVWRAKGPDGNVTVMLYDLMGRQTATITSAGKIDGGAGPDLDLGGLSSASAVDALNPLDPQNPKISSVRRIDSKLDLLGRVMKQTLPHREGFRPWVDQTFDRWGNIIAQSDVRNAAWITQYTYNFRNQITSQKQPDGNGVLSGASPLTQYYYDKVGNQVAVKDARGFVNGQVWDAGGHLVKELHADGGVVLREYDAFGEQVRITDAENHLTTYGYDALGRNTAITHVGVGVYTTLGTANTAGKENQNLVTAMSYDEAGRKVSETNGAGNVLRYAYDLRGNLITKTDPLGRATKSAYDLKDRKVAELDALGSLNTWTYNATGQLSGHVWSWVLTTQQYVGQRIGSWEWGYDEYGEWVLLPVYVDVYEDVYNKQATSDAFTYDNAKQVLNQATTLQDGQTLGRTYKYDAAGELTEIKDVSTPVTGAATTKTTTYTYNAAGQHTKEVMTQGVTGQATATYQSQDLYYDKLGRLCQVVQAGDGITIDITYDKVGNKASQVITRSGTSTQNVADYGWVEGRDPDTGDWIQVWDVVGYHTENVSQVMSQTLYFAYDKMNRQILVDGLSAVAEDITDAGRITLDHISQGTIGGVTVGMDGTKLTTTINGVVQTTTVNGVVVPWASANRAQGHILTYDKNGNRTSDTTYGTQITATYSVAYHNKPIHYLESGEIDWEATGWDIGIEYGSTSYGTRTAAGTMFYTYDAAGRLATVSVGAYDQSGNRLAQNLAVVLDKRLYDGASRMVKQGPPGSVPTGYLSAMGSNTDNSGVTSTINKYDAAGQLVAQHVVNQKTASGNYEGTYSYDAAGNMSNYKIYQGSVTSSYNLALTKIYGGYKDSATTTTVSANGGTNFGTVSKAYDAAGLLVGVTDSTDSTKNRTLINDASGYALKKTQNNQNTRQLVVNGEVVARYDQNMVATDPLWNFDLGFTPITNAYPAAATGNYPVQSGDTLESIAQAAYGDSSLWYVIAEANGLAGNEDLRVGEVLSIPSRVGSVHNTSETRAPYDPSKIVGSTTPDVPVPQASADGGCGGLGMIIMIVVAVVVTIYTAGAAAGAMGAVLTGATGTAASTMALGAAVLAGGTGVTMAAGAAGIIAAAAIGGAVGSIVSQGVGIAIGAQDSFSWEQVGMSALGSAATAGVGRALSGVTSGLKGPQAYGAAAGKAAVSNAITQGVEVAVGMQDHFSWTNVAASAVGAGVGMAVGDGLSSFKGFQDFVGKDFGGKLVNGTISGFAAGMATSVMHGGKIDVTRVATDAFGNALASSIADEMKTSGQQEDLQKLSKDLKASGSNLLKTLPEQVVGKWGEFMSRINSALRADYIPDKTQFTDEQLRAYDQVLKNTGSEEKALRLTPLMAEAAADRDLQTALNWGGGSQGVAGPRPDGNPRAAKVYDDVLKQMTLLKGEEAARVDAYQASLLTTVAAKVDKLDQLIQTIGIKNVDPTILENRNVYAAALVSKDVYFDNTVQGILPSNIFRIDSFNHNDPNQSGLFISRYGDELTGKMFVAARGTELGVSNRISADFITNALQLAGKPTGQYDEAMKYAQQLSRGFDPSNLIFTGHSLGGGLASAMAEVTPGSQGITFNAAGLSSQTVARFGYTLQSNQNIQAFYVQGEMLTLGQTQVAPMLAAGTSNLALKLALNGVPTAAGTPIPLAPITDSKWEEMYVPGVPMKEGPEDAFYLHGQTQLVNALGPRIDRTILSLTTPAWRPNLKPALQPVVQGCL